MATYNLTVNIQKTILDQLATQNMNLCFATQLGTSFNVAALVIQTPHLAATNTITWTTNYSIAATQQPFEAGSIVSQGKSKILPIVFGEVYNLTNWQDISVDPSKNAPSNSFGIEVANGLTAKAIIFLDVPEVSSTAPMYISNYVLPGFTDIFTPTVRIALWFQTEIKSSDMIELDTSLCHLMDFTTRQTWSTTYNNDGTWTDGATTKVNYLKLKSPPAYTGKKKAAPPRH